MSSSHLFLGLPIALLVLYLELRSGFHSAAFSAIFHTVKLQFSVPISISFFCVSCSSNESLHVPSCPKRQQCFSLCIRSNPLLQSHLYPFPYQSLLQMSLHCLISFCALTIVGHQCYFVMSQFLFLLWAQYLVSRSFLYFPFCLNDES